MLISGLAILAYCIYVVKSNQEEREILKAEVIQQDVIVEDTLMQIAVSDEVEKYPPRSDNELLRDSIINFGMQLLEVPYVTAGTDSNGFDCSGFVYYVFGKFGIEVPRSSINYADFGKEVEIEEVQKGDILLFLSPTRNEIGHVGIVSKAKGKESEFIHSSSGKSMGVVIASLTSKGYSRRFVKAVDVL